MNEFVADLKCDIHREDEAFAGTTYLRETFGLFHPVLIHSLSHPDSLSVGEAKSLKDLAWLFV